MLNDKKKRGGGLLKDLKPNSEIQLRNSQYVVRNVGLYPIRIQIYLDEKRIDNEEKARRGGNLK